MDIHGLIEEMDDFIQARDWDGLEAKHRELCAVHGGRDVADEIADIPMNGYEAAIVKGLDAMLKENPRCRTVYFEYDMDNGWSGRFFSCLDYTSREDAGDRGDDWACEFDECVEGPSQQEFFVFYHSGFDAGEEAVAINSYLIARTVASFGRAAQKVDRGEKVICLAFHDQAPIMRIAE
jgi:hypothetical protein